ncbi:hypothetical protein [Erythrobacter sp.]|uniref:hypothetical protein n=1 Tax=Erythrobacter sp. TaxID=1042 RepID=UPI001425C822|nr:hypothetical protein [Erythrobacter sp.]QIQ87155.1 MAG: hypothetical protein G9473_11010 [Erythrobacter sp.]
MSTRPASPSPLSEVHGDSGAGWQLVLADLALILFLVTLAALANLSADEGKLPERASEAARFDPSQALYRPGPDAPPLGQWLARQQADRRATLTIYARHAKGEEAAAWTRARALAREAAASGVAVRVVIEAGEQSALHASLGYDGAPR